MNAEDVQNELSSLGSPEKAARLMRFFRTGPGEYGEGDLFYGLTVPQQRSVAARYKGLDNDDIVRLLNSPCHECRLTALLIMIEKYKKGGEEHQREIAELYLANTARINNWDLVDLSCYKILGPWLENRDRSILYKLAESDMLWEQRIAIITTMHFIRKNDFDDCLAIADLLLDHQHDLIHKAVGWMLREIGKRDLDAEDAFLKERYRGMPRTMLRYAIEKHPEPVRQAYLKGLI